MAHEARRRGTTPTQASGGTVVGGASAATAPRTGAFPGTRGDIGNFFAGTEGVSGPVNVNRVYEVYRWFVRKGPEGKAGDRDLDRLNRLGGFEMGPVERALLRELISLEGNFQPAFDYRQAQKSGADAETLSAFGPSEQGFSDFSGTPVTLAELLAADAAGIDNATLGKPPAASSETVIGGDTGVQGRDASSTVVGGARERVPGSNPLLGAPRSGGVGATVLGGGATASPDGFRAGPGSVSTGRTAVPRSGVLGAGTATGIVAAQAAALRERSKARRTGRQSTIIGGFGVGTPTTKRATLLGT